MLPKPIWIAAALAVGLLSGGAATVCAQAPAAPNVVERLQWDRESVGRCRRTMAAVLDFLSTREALFASEGRGKRHLPPASARQDLLSAWASFDDTLQALDAIAVRYKAFRSFPAESQQREAFHLYRAAIYAGYRYALDLVALIEGNPALDVVLNEAQPALGMTADSYARFKYRYLNVLQAATFAGFEALAETYGPTQDAVLAAAVASDRGRIWAAGKGPGPAMTVKNGWLILNRFAQSAWFPVQKGVAGWMGDTKVHRVGRSLITPQQIAGFRERLQPGDILLERREWYMTNVGIPGFWTHAALYVGTPDIRKQYFDDAHTADWLARQGASDLETYLVQRFPDAYAECLLPWKDGHPPAVIEAVAEGVVFTSLDHSAGCDSLAVLRPRLSKAEKARAVALAFQYKGRPYDYGFDFASDASLVCTELIYKAYAPDDGRKGLDLPLEQMMGRMVTPANAIARDFERRFNTESQQLDLVLFLDGVESAGQAVESDVAGFLDSWKRPKWHILIQK
jgi:hypothetical protein